MILKFEEKYFQKFNYSKNIILGYYKSAYKDLKIAKEAKIPDVAFLFSYNALIKLGISLIAIQGYKVNSRMGHHIKIINFTAKILKNKEIASNGNGMRKTRNTELYDGGVLITKKQADAYLKFINKIFLQSEIIFKEYFGMMF